MHPVAWQGSNSVEWRGRRSTPDPIPSCLPPYRTKRGSMRMSLGIVSLGLLVAAAAACNSQSQGSAPGQTGSTSPAPSPAVMGDRAMIVLLRDQLTGLDPSRGAAH